MVKHIILDTDIGGDPDDFFALLLALNSPEIKIDLIVTCDEHKGHRASFTKQILKKLKKDIPVVQGKDIGHDLCLVCDFAKKDKIEKDYLAKLKEVVEKNSKTYYVCISPETNLAKFLDYAPELKSKLELVIMGGALNYRKKGEAEHNIRYDVDAARNVFYFDIKKRYVLSDTTFKKSLIVDKNHQIYKNIENSNSPIKTFLLKNMQNFFEKYYPATMMHDPLTLSYLIKPEFLTFEQKKIDMNEKGIMQLSDKGKLTTVSCDADYQRFMKFLEKRLEFLKN